MWLMVLSAPISIPSAVSLTPRMAAMPVISTTTFGRLTRSLNQDSESLPPASFQTSALCSSSSATASSMVVGRYSSKPGMTSLIIMAGLPLHRVGLQRLVGLRPIGKRIDDHVADHRRAVEVFAAERVRDGVEQRRRGGAHDRLAHALGAARIVAVRPVDRRPAEHLRHVEIGFWLGLVELHVGRQAELMGVDAGA